MEYLGRTLASFDEDNLIPCYGFWDALPHDQEVFSFYPEDKFCDGFEDVLRRYRALVPNLRLAGPTSFAPIIERSITIVEQSGGQYHVLLIIADGQNRSQEGLKVRISDEDILAQALQAEGLIRDKLGIWVVLRLLSYARTPLPHHQHLRWRGLWRRITNGLV